MIKKVKVTDLVCIDKITNSTEKEPNTSRQNKKIVKLNFKKHKQKKKRKKEKKEMCLLRKKKQKQNRGKRCVQIGEDFDLLEQG